MFCTCRRENKWKESVKLEIWEYRKYCVFLGIHHQVIYNIKILQMHKCEWN